MKMWIALIGLFLSLNAMGLGSACKEFSPLGGGDAFPWSTAEPKPFPWNTIQGLWRVVGDGNLIFKFKVTHQNTLYKSLVVEVYNKSECMKPKVKGVGVVTSLEKNVVRLNLKNKMMKLAMFDAYDLEMNPADCGETVLVSSLFDLGYDSHTGFKAVVPPVKTPTNMVLKKITGSLDLKCGKKDQ